MFKLKSKGGLSAISARSICAAVKEYFDEHKQNELPGGSFACWEEAGKNDFVEKCRKLITAVQVEQSLGKYYVGAVMRIQATLAFPVGRLMASLQG